MLLRVRTFTGGPLSTNGFLVSDEDGRAVIIDVPPGTAAEIAKAVRMYGLTLVTVVITHPHWDHFADAGALRERTGAPFAAHLHATPRLMASRTTLFPVSGSVSPPPASPRTAGSTTAIRLSSATTR